MRAASAKAASSSQYSGFGAQAAGGGLSTGSALSRMGAGYFAGQMASSRAHDRAKNMMTRGPTYRMIGLRKAGLNPIAAAGGALGVGGSGGGFASSPVVVPGGGSATPLDVTGASAKNAQRQLLQAQTKTQQGLAMKAEAEGLHAALGLVESAELARLYGTEEGRKILLDRITTQSLPDNIGAALFKMFLSGKNDPDAPRRDLNAPVDQVLGTIGTGAKAVGDAAKPWIQKGHDLDAFIWKYLSELARPGKPIHRKADPKRHRSGRRRY